MQSPDIIFLLNFLLETLLFQHRTRRQLDAFRSCNHKLFDILPTLLHKICKVCTAGRACDWLAGAACAFFARRLMFVHLVRVLAPPIFCRIVLCAIGTLLLCDRQCAHIYIRPRITTLRIYKRC